MSLIGALNVGKSALATHQAAIQVTSNNVANAGNPDYTRQVARVVPKRDYQLRPGMLIGSGVNLESIERQIDAALEDRIRGSISDSEMASSRQLWLGRVESIFHEMGDDDLSSQMNAFFGAWSDLAGKPQDMGLRQIVITRGEALAGTMRDLRAGLDSLQGDVARRMEALVRDANGLARQVADLNRQIVTAEGGAQGLANGLRDQRDAVLKRLSELMDVKVVETSEGVVNVLAGSEPIVLGDTNRGLAFGQETVNGQLVPRVLIASDQAGIQVSSGQIGALFSLRQEIGGTLGQLDDLAGGLIFELNKLHAQGQGLEGLTDITGGIVVDDPAAALNSTAAGLEFAPVNGSFVVHLKQKVTGLTSSTLIQVDLDGLNGDDTTLNALAAALDGIDGLSATVTGGQLRITTDGAGGEFSFSQDSSGVLAALGINVFFTGTGAQDIGVNAAVKARPGLLAAAGNGQVGDNATARTIADLASRPLASLEGISLEEAYERMINQTAVSASGARTSATAAASVRETLLSQREALSGVSLDEEAINLIREQRAFQAAARLIAAVDEMMRTLISLV